MIISTGAALSTIERVITAEIDRREIMPMPKIDKKSLTLLQKGR